MTLAQRSPATALPRQTGHGQVPAPRTAVPGARLQPGFAPAAQRPLPVRPMVQQPAAPRPTVRFMTVAEVAAMMRVSKMTVYRLVHNNEMAAGRVGRSFRVPAPAVRAYLDGARTDAA